VAFSSDALVTITLLLVKGLRLTGFGLLARKKAQSFGDELRCHLLVRGLSTAVRDINKFSVSFEQISDAQKDHVKPFTLGLEHVKQASACIVGLSQLVEKALENVVIK
jgi:hypothetical protein